MSKSTNKQQQADDANLVAGLQKHQTGLPPLMILGKSYTATDAVTVLQSRIAKVTATQSAKAAWQASMQAGETEILATKAFVSALEQQIRVWFANAPDTLSDFGMVPRKQAGPVSPITRVLAAAKLRATRAKRHTMGKVQKEAIKGTIPATISIAAPLGSAQVERAALSPIATVARATNASNGVSSEVRGNGSAPKGS